MLAAIGRILVTGLTLLVLISSGRAAETLTPQQQQQAERFAANNSLFVLYHEVAHLLVHQLGLPVLGKEEDAADNMASYMLLQKGTREAHQALADAAYGWLLSGLTYGANLDDSDYYGSHSLDKQRAFAIVCLMVGSNAEAFSPIADEYKMGKDRQESCYFDFELVKRSLEGVLGAYWQKNGPQTEVSVTYHAASGQLKPAADAFKASGIFDQVAEELKTSFPIPKKVSFRAKRCGEANAFYDPSTVEVIFCYELMNDFMQLISKDMPQEFVPQLPVGVGRAASSSTY